jgi:hypothetical protein
VRIPHGNVLRSCDLSVFTITRRPKCQDPEIIRHTPLNTPKPLDGSPILSYNTLSSVNSHKVLMVSYQMAQKRRVRITLDMEVLSDFNPREIDFEKVFKLEPTEKVEAYIEDMDIDW